MTGGDPREDARDEREESGKASRTWLVAVVGLAQPGGIAVHVLARQGRARQNRDVRVEDGAPPGGFPEPGRARQGIIRRIARARGDAREEREDLAQEICLQLWRAHASFGGRAKVSTRVCSAGLKGGVSVVRRRARRPRTEPLPESLDPPAGERDDRSGEVEMLHAAMRRLGESERSLVLLWLEERSGARRGRLERQRALRSREGEAEGPRLRGGAGPGR